MVVRKKTKPRSTVQRVTELERVVYRLDARLCIFDKDLRRLMAVAKSIADAQARQDAAIDALSARIDALPVPPVGGMTPDDEQAVADAIDGATAKIESLAVAAPPNVEVPPPPPADNSGAPLTPPGDVPLFMRPRP